MNRRSNGCRHEPHPSGCDCAARRRERPFAELKYRIFEQPRFLLRGRWGAGTEMTLAVLAYNLKQAIRALGRAALIASLTPA